MRILRHWKMILGLTALFGAGFVSGAIGLLVVAVNHPTPEALNRWVNFRFREYEHRLKLTPEQKVKVRPIVQNTREQVRAVARTAIEQSVPILDQAQMQIAAELTPEQKAEFEKMNRETMKRLREFALKEGAAGGSGEKKPPGK